MASRSASLRVEGLVKRFGKTTALVRRIVDSVAAGTPVESIVAVTFTHAAAGNMKLRVRHELEHRRAAEADPEVRTRLANAARSLDRAFIGTEVELNAWVRTFRNNQFIALNDGSAISPLQAVVALDSLPEETLRRITTGAALKVKGELVRKYKAVL